MNPQSSWIMEREVSNQPRRKVITDSFGGLRSNINISPKLSRQRTWQDTITLDKEAALADCKAKSYEYGDALISRDVACDELKGRKKENERPQQQQGNFQQEQPVLENKENVSVSSELPVAKSKWGVKLRHVITRDASLDDKNEVEQPIYNFRTLSKRRPRSALLEDEIPKISQEINKLWRTKSNDLLLDSKHNEDSNNHEHESTLSVLQRMKSFELHRPVMEKPVDSAIFNKETNRLCLEDLLNLDKQNLSIDVIDKLGTPVVDRRKVAESKSINDKREQYSEVLNSSSGGSENNLYNVKKETLNKKSVFGKIKSKQSKKAITLEELLKLDEQNLSVDVVDKCKPRANSESKVSNSSNLKDSKAGTDFKIEKQITSNFILESGHNLNKSEKENLQNSKCVNDTSGITDLCFKLTDTTSILENDIDSNSYPIDIPSSTRSIETKPVELVTPQQRINTVSNHYLNFKEKMLNEKLDMDAKKNDTNTRYNKLGQIILSNDTIYDDGLVKNKSNTSDNININNSELKSTESTGSSNYHTRVNSDIKYNKLGQIILSNDNNLENLLSDIKNITETYDNVNNNTEVKGMRNSASINQSDWKMDHSKKCNEICEINNNQKIVGVTEDLPNVDPETPTKNSFNHDVLFIHSSNDKINRFDESEIDTVDMFIGVNHINGLSVKTGTGKAGDIEPFSSKFNLSNNSNVEKQSENECYDQKCKNDITGVTSKHIPDAKFRDQKTIDEPPEN